MNETTARIAVNEGGDKLLLSIEPNGPLIFLPTLTARIDDTGYIHAIIVSSKTIKWATHNIDNNDVSPQPNGTLVLHGAHTIEPHHQQTDA